MRTQSPDPIFFPPKSPNSAPASGLHGVWRRSDSPPSQPCSNSPPLLCRLYHFRVTLSLNNCTPEDSPRPGHFAWQETQRDSLGLEDLVLGCDFLTAVSCTWPVTSLPSYTTSLCSVSDGHSKGWPRCPEGLPPPLHRGRPGGRASDVRAVLSSLRVLLGQGSLHGTPGAGIQGTPCTSVV